MPLIGTCNVVLRNAHNQSAVQEDFVIPSEMKYGFPVNHFNFYNLEIRTNLLHYTVYFAAIILLAVIGTMVLCTKDVMDFSFIRYTSMMFTLTAMQIRELHGTITQSQLNTIIKTHQATLKCFDHLQKALNLASLEVLRALQELSWYKQSPAVQKGILFMIQSAQRPIVLTAAKLIPINIAQFSEIVKKSYSVYLVLKDIF
ncbi:AGAP009111-PA-like protein [Anopheles sinensis]|uniref:AGAP009111-PA-like protein n=1 Tax=Anopheles sinensis TaxID=74873 RepID=A0A084VLX8_ANOSI|nr:AGAP009111-PA-like protein [Anopheles sinensis]